MRTAQTALLASWCWLESPCAACTGCALTAGSCMCVRAGPARWHVWGAWRAVSATACVQHSSHAAVRHFAAFWRSIRRCSSLHAFSKHLMLKLYDKGSSKNNPADPCSIQQTPLLGEPIPSAVPVDPSCHERQLILLL